MALHLITGYAGFEHITSADQGAYNMATFGSGNFVLDRGQKFAYQIKTNNLVTISDGEAMLQGRFIKMPSGTSENITISNGTQGRLRNDLICIRYEKSAADSTESAKLIVLTGTAVTSNPVDPAYINGNITDGEDTIADFPLYRVRLNGINIETVTQLFSVKVSMTKYMDDYQMPVGSKTQAGALQVGSNLSVNNGVVNYILPTAGKNQLGGIKLGKGFYVDDNGFLIQKTAGIQTSAYFSGISIPPMSWSENISVVLDTNLDEKYRGAFNGKLLITETGSSESAKKLIPMPFDTFVSVQQDNSLSLYIRFYVFNPTNSTVQLTSVRASAQFTLA